MTDLLPKLALLATMRPKRRTVYKPRPLIVTQAQYEDLRLVGFNLPQSPPLTV